MGAYRNFAAGSLDSITVAKGNLVLTGAYSWLTLTRRKRTGAWESYFTGTNAGAFSWEIGFENSASNRVFVGSAAFGNSFGTTSVVDTDGWVIVGVTKATGTIAPRMHIYKSGAWTHETGSAAVGAFGAWDAINMGRNAATDALSSDVAWQALWESELSDASVELASRDWATLLGTSPAAAWTLDQVNLSPQLLTDWKSKSNQTAIVGTTIGTDSTAPWVYGPIDPIRLTFDPVPFWRAMPGRRLGIVATWFTSNTAVADASLPAKDIVALQAMNRSSNW